jgi:hypothetical protein
VENSAEVVVAAAAAAVQAEAVLRVTRNPARPLTLQPEKTK